MFLRKPELLFSFHLCRDWELRREEDSMNGFKEVMETLQEQNIEVQLVEHERLLLWKMQIGL